MGEQNMTLLSQSEIDTLIEFLNREKEKKMVESQVLSQESIDKLIQLIHGHRELAYKAGITLTAAEESREVLRDFYGAQEAEYTEEEPHRLWMQINEKDQAELCVGENTEDAQIRILPEHLRNLAFQGESAGWGVCVMPVVFAQVAAYFDLKYTDDVMEQVRRRYALKMYGDENASIPAPFLAE